MALPTAALAEASCSLFRSLIHQDRARAVRDRSGVDGSRMRSGGAPDLYWRVDDDGVLHVFDRAVVRRGDAALCGEGFRGDDGPASPREIEVIRAANRLVKVHPRCMAISVALRG
jgi:hypothetical protein